MKKISSKQKAADACIKSNQIKSNQQLKMSSSSSSNMLGNSMVPIIEDIGSNKR